MKKKIIFKNKLFELDAFTKKIAEINKPSDLILLVGELGVGKTTFARSLINSFYKKNKLPLPSFIKSPTFPIMISYNLNKFEINHYDLFRLKNTFELDELNVFEDIINNISIIEWPKILIPRLENKEYYYIKIMFFKNNTRKIEISHSTKKIYL